MGAKRPGVLGITLDVERASAWDRLFAAVDAWRWLGVAKDQAAAGEWLSACRVGVIDALHPDCAALIGKTAAMWPELGWVIVGEWIAEVTAPSVLVRLPYDVDGETLRAAVRLGVQGLSAVSGTQVAEIEALKARCDALTQSLAELWERQRRLSLLSRGMAQIASLRAVEAMLQAVVDLSRELFDARYAALAVLNPDESIAQFITSGMSSEEIARLGSLPRGRGLLGEVIRTRRPLRVADISSHPSSVGWPPHHPPMRTFLGVPMVFQDAVVGHLYLTEKRQGPFTEADQELCELLAYQAAALISNARLNQDLERLAVVEERQRISMELHDGTLQTIFAVLLGLDTVLQELPPSAERAREALNHAADRLSRATQDIRRYILDLKQSSQDLLESIQVVAQDLAITQKLRIHTADPSYRNLTLEEIEHLRAWVREALTNVVRHAHARQIDITWRKTDHQYHLVVEDDGVGFDLEAVPASGHHGLRHLQQRAELLGGRVHIHSRPRQGTRVELVVPLPSRAG